MENITENTKLKLFRFSIDDKSYAVDLKDIIEVISIVEITPLIKIHPVVLGIINVRGEIIPIVDIRKLFNLKLKSFSFDDKIVICSLRNKKLGFVIEKVDEYFEVSPNEILSTDDVWPGLEGLQGIVKISGDIVFINNLESFLSERQQMLLEKTLNKAAT